jgi:hypothetical protein
MMLDAVAESRAPAMDEADARDVLADMCSPYRIPTDWFGDDHTVVAYTHDPVMAALAADTLARRELGDGYPLVAGGGLVVEGPYEVVLTGPADADSTRWRRAVDEDAYALLMCLVRPARTRRPVIPARDTGLVGVFASQWGPAMMRRLAGGGAGPTARTGCWVCTGSTTSGAMCGSHERQVRDTARREGRLHTDQFVTELRRWGRWR